MNKQALKQHEIWLESGGEKGQKLNLPGKTLRGFDFSNANLSKANFIWSDLKDSNLSGANLEGACLKGANLGGVNPNTANLGGANLGGANLEGADLKGADIKYFNFEGANLEGANLQGANLRYCTGNGREIKNLTGYKWAVVFTKDVLAIGCQQYTQEQWEAFTDEEINEMDKEALKWWKKHKDFIFKTIKKGFPND